MPVDEADAVAVGVLSTSCTVGLARRQNGHWKSENSIISIGALVDPFIALLAVDTTCRGGSSCTPTPSLRRATSSPAAFIVRS